MFYVVEDWRTCKVLYKTESLEKAEEYASQSKYYEVEDDELTNELFYSDYEFDVDFNK